MAPSKKASPISADASQVAFRWPLPALLVEYASCGTNRAIDMADRPISPPLGVAIVLFARDVRTRLVEILQGLVDPAGMVGTLIDRRMIVQVLAVVVRGLFEIPDGGVDLTHGCRLVGALRPVTGPLIYKPARGTQVRQRMQVGGVVGGSRRGCGGHAAGEHRANDNSA